MTTIPEIDLGWAAGFMDGEGCFAGHRGATNRYVAAMVQVAQTASNREVLDRLNHILGGNGTFTLYGGASKARPGSRPKWHLQWNGERARSIGALLYPYLGSAKRAQIDGWGAVNPRHVMRSRMQNVQPRSLR